MDIKYLPRYSDGSGLSYIPYPRLQLVYCRGGESAARCWFHVKALTNDTGGDGKFLRLSPVIPVVTQKDAGIAPTWHILCPGGIRVIEVTLRPRRVKGIEASRSPRT